MDREEEIETKHLSIKKAQWESILTVKDQSIESLKIHEFSLEEMTDELGEFVNYEVEQAHTAWKAKKDPKFGQY